MDNATLTKHAEAILRAAGMRESTCLDFLEVDQSAEFLTALRAAVEDAKLDGVKAGLEAADRAVVVCMVKQEWPPQDGDQQIDEVREAIRALDPAAISATVGGGV